MEDYKREVGRRLRAVRHMQGLTLADVEDRSDGEWKAVVVGSYERGDRGISVPRLSALADFYGVPIAHLLPGDGRDADGSSGASIDLAALAECGEEFSTLARYVDRIKQERGDYNGRVLTLRGEDLRTVAAAIGLDHEVFLDDLRRSGLVAERPFGGLTAVQPHATAQ